MQLINLKLKIEIVMGWRVVRQWKVEVRVEYLILAQLHPTTFLQKCSTSLCTLELEVEIYLISMSYNREKIGGFWLHFRKWLTNMNIFTSNVFKSQINYVDSLLAWNYTKKDRSLLHFQALD